MTAGGTLAIFESLTGGEVIMISVFALVVLGPERLPEVARSAGEWINKLKQLTANLQGEMQEVLDDPAMQPLREVGEFVAQPRKKLSEIAADPDSFGATPAAAPAKTTTDAAPANPAPATPPTDSTAAAATTASASTTSTDEGAASAAPAGESSEDATE